MIVKDELNKVLSGYDTVLFTVDRVVCWFELKKGDRSLAVYGPKSDSKAFLLDTGEVEFQPCSIEDKNFSALVDATFEKHAKTEEEWGQEDIVIDEFGEF
ncbi:hypothetical protein ACQ0P8_16165 (plasmid) [Halodesulfovibrio aestuarii]|uniref:Uncharacterized protein n=1 Tax=Halodesulfovibrio aestuarii TaxID=126333 RepID=A0A8G2CC49_9BACT|nr:hypothetical protein [Halodesulfovibrio aestuarii]SHJ71638.1 hypothetical protein SAMN05660830_03061 [Halodesulfovibrio aestuarii]